MDAFLIAFLLEIYVSYVKKFYQFRNNGHYTEIDNLCRLFGTIFIDLDINQNCVYGSVLLQFDICDLINQQWYTDI